MGALPGSHAQHPEERSAARGLPRFPRPSCAARPSLASLRVVAIGGGTGLPVVLEGLRRALLSEAEPRDAGRLTAIVTVMDDGGSSGRLRRAYRVPAPGDVRRCLLALSECGDDLRALFRFRFDGHGEVAGHSLGNLILTALNLAEGDFQRAVEKAAELLAVRGRVLPATLEDVALVAELQEGGRVRGESAVAHYGHCIRRLRLDPEGAALAPQAREAVDAADLVVIGPGSLYTSLLPPLLVRGLAAAVAGSGAQVALVMNAMTEPGESEGLTASRHVAAIRRHAPELPIHDVLLNTTPVPEGVLTRYAVTGATPVRHDLYALRALGCRPVLRDLLEEGPKVRHDPRALAAALLEIAWRADPASPGARSPAQAGY